MKKKTAIVTGSASGIGLFTVQGLSNEGYEIFAIDKTDTEYHNQNIRFIKCDVTDEDSVLNAFKEIYDYTDSVELLVNCAGIFSINSPARIENTPPANWGKVIDVNLIGCYNILYNAIALLKNADNASVIFLSSEQTQYPQKLNSAYVVSKAGVEMLSRVAAIDLIEYGIKVNTIALASTRSRFIRHLVNSDDELNDIMNKTDKNMPFGIIEPADVYKMILFLSDDSNKITGQKLLIDSGMISKKYSE